MYIADDADDGSPFVIVEAHLLSDGVLLVPPGTGHRGVDGDYKRISSSIPGIKPAASQHGNVHGVEVFRADWPITCHIEDTRGLWWA
jgi:hypothetical protein